MIGRIGSVESVTAIGLLPDAKVYRTDRIPAPQSGGIGTYAVRTDLLDTVGATVASGTWLNDATAQYPAVVLGATTAERLGVGAVNGDMQIWLGGRWFTVIGILDPVPLAPELDLGALIGWQAGQRHLGFDGDITTVYTRTDPDAVEAVRGLLARDRQSGAAQRGGRVPPLRCARRRGCRG
jgi:putative ABC transport system permease protein